MGLGLHVLLIHALLRPTVQCALPQNF